MTIKNVLVGFNGKSKTSGLANQVFFWFYLVNPSTSWDLAWDQVLMARRVTFLSYKYRVSNVSNKKLLLLLHIQTLIYLSLFVSMEIRKV